MEVNMQDGSVSSDPRNVFDSWQNAFKGLLNPQTESPNENTNITSYIEKYHSAEYLNNEITVSEMRTKM